MLPPVKLAALYCARQEMDYLESSLRSVLPFVEEVRIGLHLQKELDRSALATIKALNGSHKIISTEGNWKGDAECAQTLIQGLAAKGMTHALWLEPEDVFAAEDFPQILTFVNEHREAGQFLIRCQHYWKSPSYRIDPPDLELRFALTRITPQTHCVKFGQTNEAPAIQIPEEIGQLHCFTFASSTPAVMNRVSSMGLSLDASARWEREVWQTWNSKRQLRNLHPCSPERFRGTTRINLASLPDALADHPSLLFEINRESPRRKPAFSVIFRAESQAPVIEAFLRNIAATAPDSFEWIACVSANRPELIERLRSKPGAKLAVLDSEQHASAYWERGVHPAEGDILVFVRDTLIFEGDWLEGFQAVIERQRGTTIFLPRVESTNLAPSTSPPPPFREGISSRQLLFEQLRGKSFGQLTRVTENTVLQDQVCWACTGEVWNKIRKQSVGEFGREQTVSTFIIEDTLVFSPSRDENSNIESQPDSSPIHISQSGLAQSAIANRQSAIVSIIIPVFNNLHLTRECLESIFQNTTPGTYEVIIVDNGSTDGSREYLEALQPRLRYLRNSRNLFFARGCNRGAWAARTDNILFLNNDTVVKPGWLDAMLEVLAQSSDIGIVGNKQLFPNNNPIYGGLVWHAGKVFTEEKESWHVYFGFDSDHPAVNIQQDYSAVTGCCMLIRKALFEKLGGFDSWFQNGYEDTDFCLRAGQLNVRIVYTPKSEIVHHVSASESRFDRDVANYLRFKSRWAERIISNEVETYREAGLLPAQHKKSEEQLAAGEEPKTLNFPRVGFISSFNQRCAFSDYAAQLLGEYPSDSYHVLSDYAVQNRLHRPDPSNVFRCWDPQASWLKPLQRWIQTLDLEILHVNLDLAVLTPSFYQVFRWARGISKKLVFTLHHTSPPSALLREFCDLADAVIVHSASNRLELILNGCADSKIHVIAPGVSGLDKTLALAESGKTAESPIAIRERLGLPLFVKIIATPGFISRRKGILDVIHALGSVRNMLDIHYLVLGSPDPNDKRSQEYLQECKSTVRKLALGSRVLFVEKFLEPAELTDYLLCSDAVVLAYQAHQHSWSSAAALALSHGQGIITSSDSMFSDLEDAVLRVTQGVSLAQAIVSVLTNPFLAKHLRARARTFAEVHTWRTCADKHWEVYRSIQPGTAKGTVSSFVNYQVLASRALPPAQTEKVFTALRNRIAGKLIEFGTRSLELTRALRPVVSVTPQSELSALAKELGCPTPVLTIEEFQKSAYAGQVFESILLHAAEGMDSSVSLILAFLPHLSESQKLLVLINPSKAESMEVARQFESRTKVGWQIESTELDPALRLLEVGKKNSSSQIEQPASAAAPRTASSDPTHSSEDPIHVCWEGPQLVNHSLALVNREIESALLESGKVDLSIQPVGPDSFARNLGPKNTKLTRHYVLKNQKTKPVDIHVRHQWPPNWVPPASGHFVVIQPWEFGGLPEEWVQKVNESVDEVWAPSHFVRSLYIESGVEANRVHVVPNGVDVELFNPSVKPLKISSAKSFRFLFVGGTIHRKGIDVLLNSYLQSFRASDDVVLVIKDMGTGGIYQGQGLGERIRQIQKEPDSPSVVYFDQDLSDQEMAGLYTACHCLVHPYRGEGFALPVLEAMSCGLPVIVTAGGATDDFVDDSVGYRVPARRQIFGNREISGLRTRGDLWMLEPDPKELSAHLLHVYQSREEARKKGMEGHQRARASWTWKHSADQALKRIHVLRRRPIFRLQEKADCVVLLNFASTVPYEVVKSTIGSLQQNSYAQLKIYVRSEDKTNDLPQIAKDLPAVRPVNGSCLSSTLQTIHREVHAPFLALISSPLQFSKQWLGQLTAVARQIDSDAVVVAPSVDLMGASHYVEYSGADDDYSFQRFARSLWRQQRGQFESMPQLPAGCAVLSWPCLQEAFSESFSTDQEWLKALQQNGAPMVWAKDTFLRKQ